MNGRDTIQSIFIKQTETRQDPKPYTAYRIDVQAAVRQWHIWKRYSDFTQLHAQLSHTFPQHPIPTHLPNKRIFPPTFNAPTKVEDRRQGLEDYLRTLLSCKDDRWRTTSIWQDFLALPATTNVVEFDWLEEQDQLQILIRDIRSLVHMRNHQAQDAMMQYEVKAKKQLMTLTARLQALQTALEKVDVPKGELRRREDLVNALKAERDVLVQLVNASRQDIVRTTVVKPQTMPSQTPQQANYGDIGFDRPSHLAFTTAAASSPPRMNKKMGGGRAFGSALLQQQQKKETEATKGLDNQELLDYQSQMMKDQDTHVEQFRHILLRQKELGLAIYDELENQMDVLDSLDAQVDNTQTKLAFTNRKLSKIK
jgi:regulator of vacuolar morphogenesis